MDAIQIYLFCTYLEIKVFQMPPETVLIIALNKIETFYPTQYVYTSKQVFIFDRSYYYELCVCLCVV